MTRALRVCSLLAMAKSHAPSDYATRVRWRVREALTERGLSGTAAARQLGWTQSYMSRRMTGAVPFDLVDLDQLARLLDVAVLEFSVDPAPVAS